MDFLGSDICALILPSSVVLVIGTCREVSSIQMILHLRSPSGEHSYTQEAGILERMWCLLLLTASTVARAWHVSRANIQLTPGYIGS